MPPPVPPPSPGPTPPPVPLPTPVPLPDPIPFPPPVPFESFRTLASGSPQVFMLGLGNLISGGPRTVGVMAGLGGILGFALGGVNWVIENFASLPALAGSTSCAPPPPPPPAFFAPAGILGRYGEMGITSTLVL